MAVCGLAWCMIRLGTAGEVVVRVQRLLDVWEGWWWQLNGWVSWGDAIVWRVGMCSMKNVALDMVHLAGFFSQWAKRLIKKYKKCRAQFGCIHTHTLATSLSLGSTTDVLSGTHAKCLLARTRATWPLISG